MLKRYGRTLLLVAIVALLAARLVTDRDARSFFSLDYWQNVARYAQVMRLAHAVHVDPDGHSFSAFTDAALQAGLRSLDQYSEYFNEQDFVTFEQSSRRQYVGIGIQVQLISERIFVTNVFANGPAEAQGLLPGDAIVAVDGAAVEGFDLQAVVSKIRGLEGTQVELTIERVGLEEALQVSIGRASITLRSVDEVRMKTPTVGYLRISQFTAAVASELDDALAELLDMGMESLIIDLRDNPGGVLEASIAVASRFLQPNSVVLSVEERNGRSQDYRTHASEIRFEGSIAVLVNRNSASAAEIIAGALRDHSRAKVFGEATFGKASVQGVFSFRRGDGLRVTTARYRLPGGELINGTGVEPTHPVVTEPGSAAAAFLQTTHLRFMDAESFEAHFGFPPQADAVLDAALEEL
jgi:carboxyl-terminal processing protease